MKLLEKFDDIICNSVDLQNIDNELRYDDLKKELSEIYERKGRAAMYRSKCQSADG